MSAPMSGAALMLVSEIVLDLQPYLTNPCADEQNGVLITLGVRIDGALAAAYAAGVAGDEWPPPIEPSLWRDDEEDRP